jgi:hypothetical protein
MEDSKGVTNEAKNVGQTYQEQAGRAGEQHQRTAEKGLDAVLRSWGEFNDGASAIAAEVTGYSKQAFNDAAQNFKRLIGAKSLEQAIEIQTQYAKKAYDDHVAELSKLSQMYLELTRNAYRPSEQGPSAKR